MRKIREEQVWGKSVSVLDGSGYDVHWTDVKEAVRYASLEFQGRPGIESHVRAIYIHNDGIIESPGIDSKRTLTPYLCTPPFM